MGFTTAITTAAVVIPAVMSSVAQVQQSKRLKQAANEQERLARRQSEAMAKTAISNQIRGSRNANARMAAARMDAAASNLAESGSVSIRERDLATRLQDEINANADNTLNQANDTLQQGLYNAWNTRNQAQQAKASGIGSGVGALGSLIGGVAKTL